MEMLKNDWHIILFNYVRSENEAVYGHTRMGCHAFYEAA